jgi:hypothetical protein
MQPADEWLDARMFSSAGRDLPVAVELFESVRSAPSGGLTPLQTPMIGCYRAKNISVRT